MTTRKQAPSPLETENSESKRRRLDERTRPFTQAQSEPESCTSFDDLNVDCLVQILSFLPSDDMNSVAICSQRCREARNKESLDQTRTATIIFPSDANDPSYAISFKNALYVANGALNANYTILKIILFETQLGQDHNWSRRFSPPDHQPVLSHVMRLEISVKPNNNEENAYGRSSLISRVLFTLGGDFFSNLQELYVCGRSDEGNFLNDFCNSRPSLTRLTLKGYDRDMLRLHLNYVSDLFLDTCRFSVWSQDAITDVQSMRLPRLERFVVVNATATCYATFPPNGQSVSPATLVEMIVRHHRRIGWVRTDMLSADTVATLQQERPGVTFAPLE